ncbi:MAG: hypothetical protein AUF74_02140 [Thaumarchaeota archaeon 13_1_20CM_2_38_5]|nr:MAG: hypothetical protein AUI62_01485 [Thaumarchaeota archaeon 13_1_40CM_2_39_7]OLE39282.1 MAG: hypothetical protein AUF74_02140 [Thaumarchaeota archaeon 13_1_20CM_2_38_5]
MKTLHLSTIIKTSIFSVGCFFLVLTGIYFVENFRHEEYMEKTCSKFGSSCPPEDPWSLLPFGISGLVLALLGIYLIESGRIQQKK